MTSHVSRPSAQLVAALRRFEHWRSTPRPHRRIPSPLWRTVKRCAKFGIYQSVRAVGLACGGSMVMSDQGARRNVIDAEPTLFRSRHKRRLGKIRRQGAAGQPVSNQDSCRCRIGPSVRSSGIQGYLVVSSGIE